ncbi:T9SS type A sorting domain-containing protein [Rhodocaloribacter litoris]|uniref:T9SS type A sorting domain-containing protein n=1 Tax=Rhodocaloribacter litoris TaxID=2558931 RepID=UPI0014238277|nr:T9SS type A sorting domain-containing protein [Rhodocaloribacter litoris]QXD15495.1 T9SS type A sorting domain-containing protein [Rhodocaloribacter litoris]
MKNLLVILFLSLMVAGSVRAHTCSNPSTAPSWDNTIINNGDGTGLLVHVQAPMGFARVALDLAYTHNLTLLRPRLPDDTPIPGFSPTGTTIEPHDPALGEGNSEWTYGGSSAPTELRLPIAAEHAGSSRAVVLLIDTCGRSRAYDLVDGPLPVELVSFEGMLDGDDAVLTWKTAGELANLGFEVEHHDGFAWQARGFVDGAGTTTFARQYRYVVHDLAPGRHRFRLKQIDAGGGFRYSAEIELDVTAPEAFVLSAAYPNPFNAHATFALHVQQTQHVRVALYDTMGRLVTLLYDGTLPAGTRHAVRIDGSNLPSGTYFYRATGETFVEARPVTLAR